MPDSTRKASKRGWTTVAFGDVVRQVKDRIDPEESGLDRHVAGEHMDTDDLRIRRWGLVGDGYLGPAFHMRFKPGHVLYGSRRTYLRKVALADFEGITANTTYVLESSDPEVLLPGLLPFIMQTEAFAQHSVRESKGSVNPYVNFSDLAWFEFALPPIEEQRRMSEVLIVADQAIEALRELRIAASQLRRADLASFFTDRALPCKRLDQVASVLAGSTPNRSKSDYWGGTRLWASAKDLKVDELVSTEDRLTDAGWREATIAPTGATLIVVRGMILAHTFPVSRCLAPTAFNQDLRALVAKGDVSDRYLSLWAEWMVPWFLANTSESSHGTKRLTGEVIQAALVPCADPVAQQMFVDRQQRLVGAGRAIDARIACARETRSAALHQFFQG